MFEMLSGAPTVVCIMVYLLCKAGLHAEGFYPSVAEEASTSATRSMELEHAFQFAMGNERRSEIAQLQTDCINRSFSMIRAMPGIDQQIRKMEGLATVKASVIQIWHRIATSQASETIATTKQIQHRV